MSNFNLFFLLFIGLFLAIAVVFIILHLKNKAPQAEQSSNDAAQQSAKEQDFYRFSDAFEAAKLLGKAPADTGVNEKYFTDKIGYAVLDFDAALFGKPAWGSVFFSGEDTGSGKTASTVYIFTKAFHFSDCKAALTNKCGQPDSEWEIPYVEVNGGAQDGCSFIWKGITIELTSGSERDYIELRFYKK